MRNKTLFSIIILTHNKMDYTQACLKSILGTSEAQYEVIVIDNGSADATLDLLKNTAPAMKRRGCELKWRANRENVGCCTGRNQGLEIAGGDFIVFMDNDVMVADPLWLVKLRRCLEEEPHAGIVGPKLVYPFKPNWIQCAGVGISKKGRVQFRGRGEARCEAAYDTRTDLQCLISACFMFPRELYETIGGLDEAFNPIEFEDFDFCYRAREQGWRCIYEPSVEMYHWESITSEGTERLPNTYLIIKNGMLFRKRWRHMFEGEAGPSESECGWKRIKMPSLDGDRIR